MELEESVIMDITEAFRTEDISKTDFFDFVVAPDANDSHSIQHFAKQMRTVNTYLNNGSPSDEKETNNNNNTTTTSIPGDITGQLPASADCVTSFDASFWSEKDTVKLETAILEDLNKYCWSHTDETGNSVVQSSKTNTDGHIYTTLTVLNNGLDQNSAWYRSPLTVKEEDSSISSPNSMELQTNLDIDSILSIIPGQINGFSNSYNDNNINANTDGLIKSETYTYEDSGFADNKEELANSLIIDTPLLEAHDNFNNNNNDWKNQNAANDAADSLLRSALQGKAYVRYNGNVKVKTENNAELRKALSTPPSNKNDNNIYIKEDSDHHIPTIVAGIDAEGKVIFEEQRSGGSSTADHENPSSTQSMNDLLLCQLEQYPDDFEKLKRIADEVAESVNQFCQIDTSSVDNTSVYSISHDQIGILNSLGAPIQRATSVVSSTNKQTTKKYKRSNCGSKSQTTVQSATSTSNGIRKERSLHYCSICSKGFKDKYSVNVHIRTHTGEKPFACSLCGKSFRQKAHLAKHYQTHIAQKNAASAGGVVATKTKSR